MGLFVISVTTYIVAQHWLLTFTGVARFQQNSHFNYISKTDAKKLEKYRFFKLQTEFSKYTCWKQVHCSAHAFLIYFKTKPILL